MSWGIWETASMMPRRWDIKAIRKFMITFGLVSSVFDYLNFGVLLLIAMIVMGYIIAAEMAKKVFYKKVKF